jgi:hypothetical protein
MKQFLIMYWQTILLVLVLFVFIPMYFVVNKKWNELRTYAYKLIRVAEKNILGTKVGQERFDYVLQTLYNTLVPKWARPFITEEMVAEKLQTWFDDVKDYLDDGKVNKSAPRRRVTTVKKEGDI